MVPLNRAASRNYIKKIKNSFTEKYKSSRLNENFSLKNEQFHAE